MASPQIEDGYTRISNEILEALWTINLSPYESRVLWYIIRQTWGWGRKADHIAGNDIARDTGLLKGSVSKALASLECRQIITRRGKRISVQKDYTKWIQKLSEQKPPKNEGGFHTGNKKLPEQKPLDTKKVTSIETQKLPEQKPPTIIKEISKEIRERKERNKMHTDDIYEKSYRKLEERFSPEYLKFVEQQRAGLHNRSP